MDKVMSDRVRRGIEILEKSDRKKTESIKKKSSLYKKLMSADRREDC